MKIKELGFAIVFGANLAHIFPSKCGSGPRSPVHHHNKSVSMSKYPLKTPFSVCFVFWVCGNEKEHNKSVLVRTIWIGIRSNIIWSTICQDIAVSIDVGPSQPFIFLSARSTIEEVPQFLATLAIPINVEADPRVLFSIITKASPPMDPVTHIERPPIIHRLHAIIASPIHPLLLRLFTMAAHKRRWHGTKIKGHCRLVGVSRTAY